MTWTLSVRDGRYDTSLNFDPTKIHNTQVRINEQLDLIKDIVAYLPDFDAVYSIDDVPSQFIEWNYRLEMADHVDDQEGYFDARAESDFTYRGWQAGCSSVSPLGVLANRGKTKRGRPHDPKFFRPAAFTTALDKKTFIKDHRIAMDPCEHPELVPLHSVFASKSPTVGPLMPIFSLSKTTMHADILGVPTEQVETNGELIPWEQRNQDTLLWRGRTTGPWHKRKFDWRNTQRTRLVKMSNGNGNGKSATESSLRMLPPRSDVGRSTLEQEANAEDWERVNAHYMDVAFTGEPIRESPCSFLGRRELIPQNATKLTGRVRPWQTDTSTAGAWASKRPRSTSTSSTSMAMLGLRGSSGLLRPDQSCSRVLSSVSSFPTALTRERAERRSRMVDGQNTALAALRSR
jgi:hypothetical protein